MSRIERDPYIGNPTLPSVPFFGAIRPLAHWGAQHVPSGSFLEPLYVSPGQAENRLFSQTAKEAEAVISPQYRDQYRTGETLDDKGINAMTAMRAFFHFAQDHAERMMGGEWKAREIHPNETYVVFGTGEKRTHGVDDGYIHEGK